LSRRPDLDWRGSERAHVGFQFYRARTHESLPIVVGMRGGHDARGAGHFVSRSSTLRVIRTTAGSSPRRPWDQLIVPAVTTVPPRVYAPITAWPVRPFSHWSYHSQSSGCHRAGQTASTSNPSGVPSRCVGEGTPSFQVSSHPSHS